jgi:ATP-dependent DNA helicase DinG
MDANLGTDISLIFADSGPLATTLAGFEPREGQRQMAATVASAIERGGTLLAEAGTGTGKTLAYLIPAILSRQRVLVSTGTKNLQEQIFFKDLPTLHEAIGIPFTATLMKGRSNYLCLHRFQSFEAADSNELFERPEKAVFLPVIQAWAKTTKTGDRAELRDLPEDLPLWKEISADAETCLGIECPRYGDCYITLMRQRAAESDVVIVNHHLLCADASVRKSAYGEVIPSCATLVVDEGHQLEDVATQYFGIAFSNYRVDDLVRDAQRLLASSSFEPQQAETLARALTRVSMHAHGFFTGLSLGRVSNPNEARVRYTAEAFGEHSGDALALIGSLEGLEATLALIQQQPRSDLDSGSSPRDSGRNKQDLTPPVDVDETVATLQRRAGELRSDLRFLMRADDPDFVFYVEIRGGRAGPFGPAGKGGFFLRASPIDVSRIVRESLFDRYRTVVLTSATLAVDGSFAYVKGRLGLRDADEIRVPSEFDFRTQALLYLPRQMPPPKSPTFVEAVAREAIALVKHSQGRAFVLFTSYKVMHAVRPFIEMAVPYPVLVQGSAPRSALIDEFRSAGNAVLLATSSFWQGVDVVGEALSCVVIDKLPFASPGDPVTSARIDAITARGGDAFADYQVPLAILALQQGLGRLIRHRADRGVLAVLDPRLRTMGYGRRFLASLPPAPVTYDLATVGQFFK